MRGVSSFARTSRRGLGNRPRLRQRADARPTLTLVGDEEVIDLAGDEELEDEEHENYEPPAFTPTKGDRDGKSN